VQDEALYGLGKLVIDAFESLPPPDEKTPLASVGNNASAISSSSRSVVDLTAAVSDEDFLKSLNTLDLQYWERLKQRTMPEHKKIPIETDTTQIEVVKSGIEEKVSIEEGETPMEVESPTEEGEMLDAAFPWNHDWNG
jgi:hypothetical protein